MRIRLRLNERFCRELVKLLSILKKLSDTVTLICHSDEKHFEVRSYGAYNRGCIVIRAKSKRLHDETVPLDYFDCASDNPDDPTIAFVMPVQALADALHLADGSATIRLSRGAHHTGDQGEIVVEQVAASSTVVTHLPFKMITEMPLPTPVEDRYLRAYRYPAAAVEHAASRFSQFVDSGPLRLTFMVNVQHGHKQGMGTLDMATPESNTSKGSMRAQFPISGQLSRDPMQEIGAERMRRYIAAMTAEVLAEAKEAVGDDVGKVAQEVRDMGYQWENGNVVIPESKIPDFVRRNHAQIAPQEAVDGGDGTQAPTISYQVPQMLPSHELAVILALRGVSKAESLTMSVYSTTLIIGGETESGCLMRSILQTIGDDEEE